MAMGSYIIGATVRIPLQVTDTGIAFTEDISPIIAKIVLPNGSNAGGFPDSMDTLDIHYGAYYYDYKPKKVGDYVVIIAYYVEDVEFTVIENFTVNKKTSSNSKCDKAPRAEAR